MTPLVSRSICPRFLTQTGLFIALISLASVSQAATSGQDANAIEISTEKLTAIRELMHVSGAAANREQITHSFSRQIISILQANNTDIDPDMAQIIKREVDRVIEEQFRDEKLQYRMYELYARHFTVAELEALIAFNQSEVGRKANKVMPKLLDESMNALQAWSVELAPEIFSRVVERLKIEGYRVGKPNQDD